VIHEGSCYRWEEKEAMRKKMEEEETRWLAVKAKAVRIEAQRAALGQAC
jgi:hypothetical protein